MREAIAFARKARDGELLLRLATALWGFWSSRVYGAEGRRALEEALELSGRRPARTLLGLCTLRMLSGSSEHAARSRPGSARGVRGAGRRLQPRPGLEPRRPCRGNHDGLARHRRGRVEAGALVRTPWQLPGRAGREHLLADGERGLRSAARRGGDRPLPRVLALEGDDPTIRATCSVERAVLEAMRGDIEPCAGAARRREEDDRGSPASPCGPRSTRRRPTSSSSWRARRGRRSRRCAPASRRSTKAASAPTSRRSPASSPMRSTPRGGSTRQSASAARASRPPGPDDVLSQVLWRTARAKILARRGELETGRGAGARGHRNRRADRPARDPRRRARRSRRGARARRPPRGLAGCAREAAELYEQKGNLTALARARARARELG